MKKTDWAIRDQKLQMLDAVKRAQDKYAFLDDYRYALEKDLPTVEAAIRKYGDELRRPLYRFFAGDILEDVAQTAHDDFLRSLRQYIAEGRLTANAGVSDRLLESLRQAIGRNIETLVAGSDADMIQRAREFKAIAAESANAAVVAQTQMTQLKIESITRRTTGAEDLKKAWSDLQARYGSRDTVRYRNGAHYPLNTYLDQRANTSATDLHVLTTQYDASAAGVYTGKITVHGATDSCRPWEGKVVFFTAAGRDILSQKFPKAAEMKTVDELRADRSTHLWKFNCRHGITPYPIQFFDDGDAEGEINYSLPPSEKALERADEAYRRAS